MNLQVIDNGGYKDYYEVKATLWSNLTMKLQLPPDFTCDHCVFQWWYTAGRLHLTLLVFIFENFNTKKWHIYI